MKRYFPKIKFRINIDLEKKVLENFSKYWFKWALRPELRFIASDKFNISEKKKIINAYVENFYLLNNKKIKARLAEAEKEWVGLEKKFYKIVDILFNKYLWPRGNYNAYLSIWHCFPRFIKEKLFTFPFDPEKIWNSKKFGTATIAHEMLHFIAYDYLEKVYGLKPSESYHKDNKFWQFTENLNVLIERDKIWKEFSDGSSKPYKNCEKLFYKMKKIWDKDKDIDNLVEQIFKVKKTCIKK
jgi:hypothetical protein